jgi:hypothetical protein
LSLLAFLSYYRSPLLPHPSILDGSSSLAFPLLCLGWIVIAGIYSPTIDLSPLLPHQSILDGLSLLAFPLLL